MPKVSSILCSLLRLVLAFSLFGFITYAYPQLSGAALKINEELCKSAGGRPYRDRSVGFRSGCFDSKIIAVERTAGFKVLRYELSAAVGILAAICFEFFFRWLMRFRRLRH